MKKELELNWNEVIPYQYKDSPEVKAAFESIIDQLLKNAKKHKNPCLVHMLGIPGAGKTTFWKKNQNLFSDYLLVSFDQIMDMLPAYAADKAALGLKEAFARWEIPARIAGYELLKRAMDQKINIFLDHGGTPELHLALMKEVKKIGYHTKAYYLKCDVNTAIKRAAAREQEIQRHTPKELILKRFPLVERRAEQFKEIADEFIVCK